MRIYDPRLGRFLSTDPLTQEYPFYTPYQFAGNTPIRAVDLDGAEGLISMFLPSPFSEENTAKLKNKLKISKGSFADKTVDFLSGAGDRSMQLNNPGTYLKAGGDHLKNMYNNGKAIINAKSSSERAHAALSLGLPSLNSTELMGQQAVDAVKNGDYRTMGSFSVDAATMLLSIRPRIFTGNSSVYKGFTSAESQIINESRNILNSKSFDILAQAAKEGKQASVSINGRTITFEPEIPSGQGYRAITNSEINGFHLGVDAFKSPTELTKTILHELHRLRFSEVVKTGQVDKLSASASTQSADAFANAAQSQVLKKQ